MKRTLASVLFVIASQAGLGDASANPIINGDFETPLVNGPSGYNYRTGSQLTGWTIFSPQNGIVHFNASYAGQSIGGGLQSIQLEYSGNYIQQSIATTAGQNYILSFDLSSYVPPGTNTLRVDIDSFSAVFAGSSPNYVTHAVPFTALGPSTTIRFTNAGPTSPFTYPHLDNIAVAVPEPATLLLLGLGLAGLSLGRRRTA